MDVSDDRTADAISTKLIDLIKLKNWGGKLVAQTYDGAAVMSSALNGTQAKVREQFSNAIFIHCNAHVLNLVLSQSVNFIQETKIFFVTLSGLSAFFNQSTKRTYFFDQVVKRRIPTVATTRWNYSSRLVNIVHTYRSDLIIVFEEMIEDPDTWGADAVQARGFMQFLDSFNTVFMLNTFNDIFSYTDVLFDILQKNSFDIQYCCEHIEITKKQILANKSKFDNILIMTKATARVSLKRGENIENFDLRYKKTYNQIIETLFEQMETRFKSLQNLKFVELLNLKKYASYQKIFPTEAFESLKNYYGNFFDFIKLKNELVVFYAHSYFYDIAVFDIPSNLINFDLSDTFSEVFKLSMLILTIPVSTSSVERSFSALKRIKTYSRNQMLEERLSELALISIEKSFLKFLKNTKNFYDDVIEVFIQKTRRIEMIYK